MTARQEETWYKIIGPWIGEYKLFNKYQKQKAENVLQKLTQKKYTETILRNRYRVHD